MHLVPKHCLTCYYKHYEKIMYFGKKKNHSRKIRTIYQLSKQYTTIITYMKLSRIFQVSTKKGAGNQH